MVQSGDGEEDLRDRFVYYECGGPQFARVAAAWLLYPTWEPVDAVDHVAHALAPRSLLRELRSVIAPADAVPAQQRRTVIFIVRKGDLGAAPGHCDAPASALGHATRPARPRGPGSGQGGAAVCTVADARRAHTPARVRGCVPESQV